MRNLPRTINVALIEIGDSIEVTHKKKRGLVVKCEGTVADILYNGATRLLVTSENATILAWAPGRPHPKVTLLKRNLQNPTLFDMDGMVEIRKRDS